MLNFDLHYQILNKSSVHIVSPHDNQFHQYPNVYPTPNEIAKLIEPGVSSSGGLARPSILEKTDTKSLAKMLHFKIWVHSKINANEFKNPSDVLRKEIEIFEQHGFAKKSEFQVKLHFNSY